MNGKVDRERKMTLFKTEKQNNTEANPSKNIKMPKRTLSIATNLQYLTSKLKEQEIH